MSGAAVDTKLITGLAVAMAPTLAAHIPLQDMDEVYTLVVARMMMDPTTKASMATPHDFFAAWYDLQSRREAEKAARIEQSMTDYRAREEARLRANPRKLTHISALAERDNVTLPWTPGRDALDDPERAQEVRSRGGVHPGITGHPQPRQETPEEIAAHLERVARNREQWFKLGAESERAKSTVDSASEPATPRQKGAQSGRKQRRPGPPGRQGRTRRTKEAV